MGDEPRSLSAALKITPEVADFIQRGDSKPIASPASIAVESNVAEKPKKLRPKSEFDGSGRQERPKARRKPQLRTTESPQVSVLSQARVAITTRFRQEIADSLRRASLERKLRGESPHTQQEIIETAVAAWLRNETKIGTVASVRAE